MKKIIYIILLIIFNLSAKAQAPKAFSFQGIAIDTAGYIVASKPVSLRFTITMLLNCRKQNVAKNYSHGEVFASTCTFK